MRARGVLHQQAFAAASFSGDVGGKHKLLLPPSFRGKAQAFAPSVISGEGVASTSLCSLRHFGGRGRQEQAFAPSVISGEGAASTSFCSLRHFGGRGGKHKPLLPPSFRGKGGQAQAFAPSPVSGEGWGEGRIRVKGGGAASLDQAPAVRRRTCASRAADSSALFSASRNALTMGSQSSTCAGVAPLFWQ
jgi:hypothetical protein